jgi:hypothetical protein
MGGGCQTDLQFRSGPRSIRELGRAKKLDRGSIACCRMAGPQVRGTPWGPATTQAPASALDVPHCLINVIGIRRRAGRLPRRKNIEGGTLHDSQVLIDGTARQRLDPLRNHRSNRLDRCSHTHAAAVGAGPLIKQSHHPLDLTTRQCRVEVRKIVKRVMLGAHSSTAFRSRTYRSSVAVRPPFDLTIGRRQIRVGAAVQITSRRRLVSRHPRPRRRRQRARPCR